MNLKPIKLDWNKYNYIGCIPVIAHPEHPSDQSVCIKIDCPHCKREMWYSEKKQEMQKANPDTIMVYCLECIAISVYTFGDKVDILDIGDFV